MLVPAGGDLYMHSAKNDQPQRPHCQPSQSSVECLVASNGKGMKVTKNLRHGDLQRLVLQLLQAPPQQGLWAIITAQSSFWAQLDSLQMIALLNLVSSDTRLTDCLVKNTVFPALRALLVRKQLCK
eukprot:1629879-Rhodomonas_salina.3